MTGSTLTFRLFLLLVLPTSVLLCSCISWSMQKRLCDAAYVIKAEVTGVTDREYQYGDGSSRLIKIISVTVQETYKAKEKYLNLTVKNEIHTGANSGECGWFPPIGVYVIAGSYIFQGIYPGVSRCNYAALWSELPDKDKKVINDVSSGNLCNTSYTVTPPPRRPPTTPPTTPPTPPTTPPTPTGTQETTSTASHNTVAAASMAIVLGMRFFLP